jgi:hypothetical protein
MKVKGSEKFIFLCLIRLNFSVVALESSGAEESDLNYFLLHQSK